MIVYSSSVEQMHGCLVTLHKLGFKNKEPGKVGCYLVIYEDSKEYACKKNGDEVGGIISTVKEFHEVTEPMLEQMSKPKANIYETVLKNVQDKLMTQPGLETVEEVQQWLADFRGEWTVMLHLYGKLEKEMVSYQYQFVKQCPKEVWDRVKHSSTLITNMANSMFPNYHLYVTMKELIKACLQVSPEYNTMLSNFIKQQG